MTTYVLTRITQESGKPAYRCDAQMAPATVYSNPDDSAEVLLVYSQSITTQTGQVLLESDAKLKISTWRTRAQQLFPPGAVMVE